MKADKIFNLVGRSLTFYDTDGSQIVQVCADGRVWVQCDYQQVGEATIERNTAHPETVPLVQAVNERVVGLPPPEPGTLYVVSGLVAALVPERDDLVSPAQMVRFNRKTLGPQSLMLR